MRTKKIVDQLRNAGFDDAADHMRDLDAALRDLIDRDNTYSGGDLIIKTDLRHHELIGRVANYRKLIS